MLLKMIKKQNQKQLFNNFFKMINNRTRTVQLPIKYCFNSPLKKTSRKKHQTNFFYVPHSSVIDFKNMIAPLTGLFTPVQIEPELKVKIENGRKSP